MAAIITHDDYFTSFRSETHILVVDHNREMLDSAERILKYFAYKVSAAKSWRQALSLLANGTMKFDLVLLDAHSPNANRFNFLVQETIRNEIPLILMSDDKEYFTVANEAIQKGASFYLKKPISLENVRRLWTHAMKAKKVKSNQNGNRTLEIHNQEKNKTRIYENNIATSSKKRALYEDMNEIGTSNEFARKQNGNARCSKQSEELGKNFEAEHAYYLGHKVQAKAPCTKWSEKIRETFVADSYQLGHDDCNPRMNPMNFEPSITQVQVHMPLQKPSLDMPPVNVPQPPLVTYQPPSIENSFENYSDDFLDALFENNADFAAFFESLEPLSPNLGTTNTTNATAVEDNIDNITLGVTPNPNKLVNNRLPETEDIESFPFGVNSLLFDEPGDGNGFWNGNA